MHVSAAPRSRLLCVYASAQYSVLVVVLGLVGLLACPAGQTQPVAAPPPVPAPKPVAIPKPKLAPVQLTLVGCSHGTVGVSASNVPQPHWVIASMHLRSPRALRRLRLVSIELLDQNGKVVTRSQHTEAFLIGEPTVSYPDQCLPYARQRPSPPTISSATMFSSSAASGRGFST